MASGRFRCKQWNAGYLSGEYRVLREDFSETSQSLVQFATTQEQSEQIQLKVSDILQVTHNWKLSLVFQMILVLT